MTNLTGAAVRAVVRAAALAAAAAVCGCANFGTVDLGGSAEGRGTLVVPWNLDIRAVDGQPVSKPLGVDRLTVLLAPGAHTAEVRYAVLYPTERDDREKIRSTYHTVGFECAAGEVCTLVCDDPQNLEAARRFARDPVFRVNRRMAAVAGTGDSRPPPPPPAEVRPGASDDAQRAWERMSEAERRAFLERVNPARK